MNRLNKTEFAFLAFLVCSLFSNDPLIRIYLYWPKVITDNLIAITKTRLYFDPLKPRFYTVKLGFTGVYISFLISAQKHKLWVLVRTASPSFHFFGGKILNNFEKACFRNGEYLRKPWNQKREQYCTIQYCS